MTSEASGEGAPKPGLEGIPAPGDVIAGKFVVEEVLGVGGMGVVVSARHAQLGQKVAIKFLRRDASKAPEAVSRFLREARAVVGLHSAHVVRVTDVGVLDDQMPYMVMEHLVGTDLQALLEERKTLPVGDAVDFLLQGMEAIAEAHAMGIVHRDLKPSNLFLARSPDGSPLVKVLDFGISKASVGSKDENLTATSAVLGTPHYMSPEQLRSSKSVDARTDVWALGVILYELLVGRMPFEADTATGICAKIAADPPTPPREIDPNLPAGLEAVILRCLEKDANRRLASVAELAAVMQPFASATGKLAVDRIARIGGTPSHPPTSGAAFAATVRAVAPVVGRQTETTWQPTGAGARRRTVSPLALGVAALLALAIVVVAVRSTRGAHPEAASDAVPVAPVAASALAPAASEVAATPEPSVAFPTPSAAASMSAARAVPAKSPAAPAKRAAKPAPPGPPPADDLLLDRK